MKERAESEPTAHESADASDGAGAPSDWRGDDWEDARRRKLTLGLAATPAERLAWLEEAIAMAWASGALPRARP